jgi:hypothetical protein
MNRETWETDYFLEWEPTNWLCSACFSGNLFPKGRPVINDNYKFTVHFRCSHSDCHKDYACIGKVKYFSSSSRTEVTKMYYGPKYKRFYPLNFAPVLQLFPVNPLIPKSVITSLDESFGVFWSDCHSSANALRRALEKLLDELEVPPAISLQRRIDNFKSEHHDFAKFLSAIKWIGNSGSHGDNLTKEDILDACVIFEHCLAELFPLADKKSALHLAEEIIIRKGGRLKPDP